MSQSSFCLRVCVFVCVLMISIDKAEQSSSISIYLDVLFFFYLIWRLEQSNHCLEACDFMNDSSECLCECVQQKSNEGDSEEENAIPSKKPS